MFNLNDFATAAAHLNLTTEADELTDEFKILPEESKEDFDLPRWEGILDSLRSLEDVVNWDAVNLFHNSRLS